MLHRYGVNKSSVSRFTYRDEGCMGYMKIEDNHGNILKKIKCLHYYIPLRGFFNSFRCSLCIDHYGELADICVGDVREPGVDREETIGESSIVTRNPHFETLLHNAEQQGYINIEEISPEYLNSTQGYAKIHKKGEGIKAAFTTRRMLHKPLPIYDLEIANTYSIKYLLRDWSNYVCRFIGKHPCLWFIIKKLDRFKD